MVVIGKYVETSDRSRNLLDASSLLQGCFPREDLWPGLQGQNEAEQVHSLCVDLRPGDRLRLAKGPPHPLFFCQAQSEAHGPPSAMDVRKKGSV